MGVVIYGGPHFYLPYESVRSYRILHLLIHLYHQHQEIEVANEPHVFSCERVIHLVLLGYLLYRWNDLLTYFLLP